ncbi:MAG: RNA polymerase sigma factor [Spirochaetales bacterium]|nr:RNA polymerase sigma factor [Spirochaetales bacterium]
MVHEGHAESLLFEKVYESIYPVLYRVAYRITGSASRAEDLCHEAFIKYIERNQLLPDLDQTKYWLIRVLRNLSLNDEKKRARERRAYQRYDKNDRRAEQPADEAVLEEETRSTVQRALERLPYKLRVVLVLKEYGEMSYREIGKVLGITEGNVKVRAFRAREQLAELLRGALS